MEAEVSILICTIQERRSKLHHLLTKLYNQINGEKVDWEVLTDDTVNMTTGKKRNNLLKAACKEYCMFIDDDDDVPAYFVSKLREAIKTRPDTVGIKGKILQGGVMKDWVISKDYKEWFEKDGVYYRCPNHITPMRTEHARRVGFPDKTIAEDRDFSFMLRDLGLLKTEVKIEEPMYFYYPSR